jgi:WD40-like Beta Propeller Repeat
VNLDDRARRAAADIRREVADQEAFAPPARDPFERFERSLARKVRNQRVATTFVAAGLAVLALVFIVRAFGEGRPNTPATPGLPSGSILYGQWNQGQERAHWFTVNPDGSNPQDLRIVATCAEWFPDGRKILITNDMNQDPGDALRPAVIWPDRPGLKVLDGTSDPALQLGCGDVSPDGTRIVLEGFDQGVFTRDGIYTVRASDGGGLHRLTWGPDSYPQYSPDGTQVVFMRTKAGVQPDGAGALFVVGAQGTDARRITPWGSAFLDQAWSPDGRWIVFQRPYGELVLVHPDGSDLHAVPVDLPAGLGAREPSWSPNGDWIVFSLGQSGAASIYAVRPDGARLTRVTPSEGTQDSGPDWGP